MRTLAPLAVALFGLVSACTSSDDSAPSRAEEVAQSQAPIINGVADTAHAAVVFIGIEGAQGFGGCSGTIVKTDPASGVGWVLTAAHCVTPGKPTLVMAGQDYSNAVARRYEVLDFAAHPNYASNPSYDFGVIRILGVDASTPKMPLQTASPDGVVTGSKITNVGFGRTSRPSQNGPENSARNMVTVTVASATPLDINYTIGTKGTCSGDSGGPALLTVNGTEKIVGVVSRGDEDCSAYSIDARLSSALTFVNQQLALPAPSETCTTCTARSNSGNNACAKRFDACLADGACLGLYQCLSTCSTTTCQSACTSKFPAGVGPLMAVQACPCTETCASVCGSAACGTSTCVVPPPATTCGKCTKTSCCDEQAAAARDPIGFQCLSAPSMAACATNAAYKALVACKTSSCSTQCGGSSSADAGATDDAGEPDEDAGAPIAPTASSSSSSGCSASGSASGSGGLMTAFCILVGALAARRSRPGRALHS